MSRNPAEEKPNSSEVFQLGAYTFSLETGELTDASGAAAPLRRQSADVLAYLLRNNGAPVSKTALFDAVWAGAAVTDDSLVQCISEIRRCLDDRDHVIVQTLAKKGYKVQATLLAEQSASRRAATHPTVAVLAFDDFSVGDDRGYLSDAIAEGVIAELSRFPELAVIARNTSFSFRDAPTPTSEISRRTSASYLVEGSQQKSGDRLRVTVQLIDARAERHIWSDIYERELHDLFTAQDDVVRRVAATVAHKVMKVEGRPPAAEAQARRSALHHHLEARQHLFQFTPEANDRARRANLAAIEAAPDAPYGYVGLAFVHIDSHRWGWPPLTREEALEEAREAARKALELAPDYYDGHAAMGHVHLNDGDLNRAIASARRAMTLNPSDTHAICDLADYLGYAGRLDEAEALLRQAMRMDPLHADWVRWTMGWIQWLSGRYEDALATMNEIPETPPMANRVLALIYGALGRRVEAERAIQRLLKVKPDYSLSDVRLDYAGKFQDGVVMDGILTHLRDAGLPD